MIHAFQFSPAAVLRFSGEDHATFLQSQGTADLRGPVGFFRYSLWLDHKGLIHGDAFVLKISEAEILMVSYSTKAADLLQKFDRHIIADDVAIADETGQWRVISVPPAESSLIPLGGDLKGGLFQHQPGGYVFAGRRLGLNSLDFLLRKDASTAFDFSRIPEVEAEAIRIRAGIPMVSMDIPPGAFNPLEANLLSALSFDKGCYLGQEVVARVHRLGRFSRRFITASGAGTAPRVPFVLEDGEKEIGALTSVVNSHDTFIGIGWLKARHGDGPLSSGGFDMEVATLDPS